MGAVDSTANRLLNHFLKLLTVACMAAEGIHIYRCPVWLEKCVGDTVHLSSKFQQDLTSTVKTPRALEKKIA